MSFIIRNTGTDAANDVTVTFAGFTGANASYFSVPADLTRTFSFIDAGSQKAVYFYVDYSEVCSHSKGGGAPFTGYTANYTITAVAAGLSPVVRNGTVTTNELISAAAAGVSLSTTLGPGFYVGQLLTQTVDYKFGNNTDLFFQPAGEAGFDAGCIRLIGSEITGVSGNVSSSLIGLRDRLWFPDASVGGGGGDIYVTYTWEILCVNRMQTLHPWAAAKSGQKYKYSGFQSTVILPASESVLTAVKSVSPLSLLDDSSGPVTWTVTFFNPAAVPLTIAKITDVLPECMSINEPCSPGSDVTAANSESIPGYGATGTVTWVGLNLGDNPGTAYQVPAGGTLVLKYTTDIVGCAYPASYANSVTWTLGEVTGGPMTATLKIGGQPEITLTKSVSPAIYGTVGETITYTYFINNSGNVTLDGPFSVTDSELGSFPCGSAPILPGNSTSCTATQTITQADLDAGSIVNTAIVSTTYNAQPVTSNQATATVGILKSLKSVTDENGGNLEPGDALLYNIVFQNQSGYGVAGIEFTDAMPANTSYIASSVTHPAGSTVVSETPVLDITGIDVPAHSQVIVTFRVRVNSPLTAGVTQIVNQGTVSYDSDGNGTNDATQQTDGDTASPGEQPTVIPVTAGPNFSETAKAVLLQADADGNGVVSPGDTLRYTVVMPNTGSMDSGTATLFQDPVPFNTTYVPGSVSATSGSASYDMVLNRIEWTGTVTAGSSVTVVFDVTVDSGITVGTVISNQGTVHYASDGGGTNDSTELTDGNPAEPGKQPTEVTVGGRPEGVAIKSVTDENGGNLVPGDRLLYTVILRNQSGFNVTGLEFTDAIPDNTSYIAASVSIPSGSMVVSESPLLRITGIDVPAHSEVIISFRVTVDDPLPAGVTQIINQGMVFYDSDGDGVNDSTQQTDGDISQPGEQPTIIPVTAGPNFSETTKTVSLQADADADGVVTPGDTLRYTVVIRNTGDQDASGVTFTDSIPFNTTYVDGSVSATAGTASYNAGPDMVQWTGNILAGTSVTIIFDVTVDSGIITGTVISNQGSVHYDSSTVLTDGNPAEPGKQPTEVTVGGRPEGVAIKSVTDENGGNLVPGDSLLYTVILRNQSGFNVTGLEFTDAIPDNTSYITGSVSIPSGSMVVSESPLLKITGIDVPAHSEVIISFRVTVDDPLPAGVTQIINQGMVFYDSDGDGVNDSTQQTDGNVSQPGEQPTIIPVTASGPPEPVLIPTLSKLGMTFLAMLMAACALAVMRRKIST